jgi:DNA-directed RNA polymerase specialized sigma24 family protein
MPMSSEGSVSRWIGQLKVGDPAAAECLWGRYFEHLVGLARTQLRGAPRRVADEEDVALSAFDSFCRGAERGRFPELVDRDSLWRLLVTITLRKAHDLRRDAHCQKRGGGEVLGESELPGAADSEAEAALEQVVGREPDPGLAAQVAEECRRLLGRLEDAALQSLALLKMEGYTNHELAARLGWGLRTVERKLRLIRQIWEQELAP